MGDLFYTGIGSRNIPPEYFSYFEEVGFYLSQMGFTLRSGGADGADTAFEEGCVRDNGKKEIYLPWRGFNGRDSSFERPTEEAHTLASQYHPFWFGMKKSIQSLHARNSHQVLGMDLETPSLFIICWTNPYRGGMTQALRLAVQNKIPIFNYFNDYYKIDEIIDPFLKKGI